MRSVAHLLWTRVPRALESDSRSGTEPLHSLGAPTANHGRSFSGVALAVAAGLGLVACETTQEPPPTVASVVVAPATVSLTALGDTMRLTARAYDASGNAMAGVSFTWSSSAESIATVDTSGSVTAVANGVATVTATSDGVAGNADVTVAQEVATVAVTPPTASLTARGDTIRLTAGARDANGHAIAGVTFTWASSATSIATVDASGLVTAVASGSATVTATANGTGGNAVVTVAQVAASVTVTPVTASLTALGATVQFAAAAHDANGHPIAGKTFAWASSNAGVATVGASGLVTAVANGAATITATADGAADTAEITVAQVLASVAVTPAAPSISALGATVQLAASALDANGHAITGKTFTWASSDQGIATVSPSGLVTAVANGAASITATAEGVDGTAALTVAQKAAVVVLSPPGASISGVGATQQFTVAARDAGDSPIPVSGVHATWTSLNPNVATINTATGVAAAVGAGQVTIRVEVDTVVAYAVLTVTTPGLPRVNLWAQLNSGISEGINGLWGTSATDVFATAGGRVLHYDGTVWNSVFGDIGFLNMDVWGSSASDVYVVGNAAKVLHYDGTTWSLMTSGLSNMLPDVWGASPRDIFAVSWDGTIVHFDGVSWRSMGSPAPSASLYGVWGTSASDVYAVGGLPYAAAAFHYDGTSWSEISTGVTRSIEAVWGVSGADIYAAGVDGNVFHYDGTSWTRVAFDVPIHVNEIWGSSATDIYFAGADSLDHATVLHYDGTTWRLMRSPIPYALGGIWGAPTGEVFATGDKGTIVRGYRGGTVAVTPSSATITGNTNQLQVVPSAAAGGSAVAGVTYLWTSSDEAVAVVDADGLVTGLTDGTATITATAFGGAATTATVTVAPTQAPPVAVIDMPRRDTLLTLGEAVNFQGTASDVDGTIASHRWDFGDGSGATVEDPGAHTYASVGIYGVTYRVTDDDGATSPAASVVVTVVANQWPTATITSPANYATFSTGETITFTGSATDHEDGPLTGASLVWTSSLDGQIGTGTSFTRSDLSEGTHRITLNAKDSGGTNGATNVIISVRSHTPLYLRYASPNSFLSTQPATSGFTRITLFNYGSGQSTEFQAILGNTIMGTGYGFSFWLGAGTAPGQTGTWTATLLVEQSSVQTALATHTFTVPYDSYFLEYTADVTSISGGAAGDKIILRLTLNDVSQGAVLFGAPPLDSHILAPGNVTVSPVTSPPAVSAVEQAGVRVEVTAGQSLRYPGR